jgi:hypothetical protein
VGIVAVTIFSLFYFANKFLYFSERRFVFPEVPVISKLKEVAGWDRVWGVGGGHLEKNMNIYYGLYSPEGYDALFSRRYGELLAGPGQSIGRTDADIEALSSDEMILGSLRRKRLLALLGVKYVVESKLDKNILARFPEPIFNPIWEDDKFRIWEFKEVLPRALLVTDYVVEEDSQRIINTLLSPDFDLRKKIVLEKEPGFKIEAGQAPPSLAKIIKYTPTKMEIETSSRRAGILFLSDNYYPGWRALVDGKETEILRANYTFRSVVVPKGEHQIVFSYEPKTFYWSLKVSGLAGVVFGGWLIFVRIKRR